MKEICFYPERHCFCSEAVHAHESKIILHSTPVIPYLQALPPSHEVRSLGTR